MSQGSCLRQRLGLLGRWSLCYRALKSVEKKASWFAQASGCKAGVLEGPGLAEVLSDSRAVDYRSGF